MRDWVVLGWWIRREGQRRAGWGEKRNDESSLIEGREREGFGRKRGIVARDNGI